MIQGRLEYLSETLGWLLDFQYAFRRERSMEDTLASLVSNISENFPQHRSSVVLVLDIKAAFNSILLDFIITKLLALEAPTRIVNFGSFLISEKHVFFQLIKKNRIYQ